ncbi:unnamed protein product [Alternaria alternata]
MEEGQEGPNSIFYVPGMPSETQPDYRLYINGDESISFSEWMKKMRNAGISGRVPSPPPDEKEVREGGVAMAVARFYRTKCRYCWAIVNERERETGFDMAEIEGAAEKGCNACLVICTGIRHFADMIFPSDEVIERRKLRPWDQLRIANERKRIMDTSSYDSIRQIKEWLQTCSEDHEYCAVSTESELPTRVLDISNKRAKVVETHGMRAQYVSLSHCWGRKPIIRLLSSNIDQLKNGIPWYSLSKTFQDSIIVAWKLGFRYIWIDALCILQDSFADWEYHASRMAQIFTDSQLTISASSSADGAGGCFSSRPNDPWTLHSTSRQIRNPNLWLPYMQTGRDREGCLKTFDIRLKTPHGLYNRRQPKEPLLKRAWVFQEQILSSRNVHFCFGGAVLRVQILRCL